MTHDEHRYAALDGQEVDARGLSARQAQELRAGAREGRVRCLVCAEPMVPKLGEQLAWHFAHRADRDYPHHEPESPQHKAGKRQLLAWAQQQWPGCEARCEWRLASIGQIADVLALVPGRSPLALEIQYADLSPAEWRARHAGYRQAGVSDLWLLGHSRLRTASGGRVRLDSLASALVADGQELLYLGPRGALSWVRLAPALRFRARQGRLGTVEALVVRGRLEQLVLDGERPRLEPSPDKAA